MTDKSDRAQINFRVSPALKEDFKACLNEQRLETGAVLSQFVATTVKNWRRISAPGETRGKLDLVGILDSIRCDMDREVLEEDLYQMLSGILSSNNKIAKLGARHAIIAFAALVTHGATIDIQRLLAAAKKIKINESEGPGIGAHMEDRSKRSRARRGAVSA